MKISKELGRYAVHISFVLLRKSISSLFLRILEGVKILFYFKTLLLKDEPLL